MRDAFIEGLRVLEADVSLRELRFAAVGSCFSVGGELREFGSAADTATAHWVRSVHSPARLLAQLSARISFRLHGACIGSGIELAAFGANVVAHKKSHFQLPELQLGLIPGAGGTVSINHRIGRQRTAWLVLSGRRINAQTALEWGLIDQVIED
jgi:enoyl-CoA hydratase/carnithine racemase